MSFFSHDLNWRKIKQDLKSELTEASITGSIASIVVGLFIFYLVVAQVADYRTLHSETNVVLDHYSHQVGPKQDNAEDTMQINFNITFPRLSCEYASVFATNFMGTHDAGLASRVSKVYLDKQGRQVGVYTERRSKKEHQELPPLGVMKEMQTSLPLGADGFETTRRHYALMIVNFCTPWSHWCQKLEPVWEAASKKIHQEYENTGLIKFAHVDCSEGQTSNANLCTMKQVDAFPTIMVFRKDDSAEVDHERFHAERSVDSLYTWAKHLVEQTTNVKPKTKMIDVNQDGDKESHNGVGCMIAGLLHVQRAPGGITIQAQSDSHEFNWATMDVSHTINHLSFGPFLTETAWKIMPPHVAQAVGSLDDKKFSSDQHTPTTHQHMIKVVKNVIELPSSWRMIPVVAHGYTHHSNNIQRFAEVPSLRINYDILPIVVHIKSTYTSFYSFITQLCGLVGGVFTVMGFLSLGVDAGVQRMTRKEHLGKLG